MTRNNQHSPPRLRTGLPPTGFGALYVCASIGVLTAALGFAQTVELAPVVSKPVSRSIDLPAEILPFLSVSLHAKVPGYVERVLVDRGSVVKEGELLIDLSAPEMQARIAEAESKVEAAEADRLQSEAQLAAALDERAKLQREIVAMRRDAESNWTAVRVENALLRERINDVAAEVARLTAALEGPGSPIETMLAAAVPVLDRSDSRKAAGINRISDEAGDTVQQGKGTLADRIRALQSGASRVASN